MSLGVMPKYTTAGGLVLPEPLEEEFGPVVHEPLSTEIRGLDGFEEATDTVKNLAWAGAAIGAAYLIYRYMQNR